MNWPGYLFAFGWFLIQNNYFGWNRHPQSDAELLADGLQFILLALAVRGAR